MADSRSRRLIAGTPPRSTKASLAVVDNEIDQTTGTVKLKATFPNNDLKLWPGKFVNARLVLTTRKGRHGDSFERRAARAAGHLRLRHQAGQNGGDAADQSRRKPKNNLAIGRKRTEARRSMWSSMANTNCNPARTSS